ncbi:MAG: glycosyltransferase family 4 protein [Candidatus Binatia bacterium]
MKIAHIGPRLARRGGPAGYLYELARAAQGYQWQGHTLVFPPMAHAEQQPSSPGWWSRAGAHLRRLKRSVAGAPRFYRPDAADLTAAPGVIHRNMLQVAMDAIRDAAESIDGALEGNGADVLFTHDMATAEYLVERRRAHQQIWLMLHTPMPQALYHGWSWAVPELDWRKILDLADVRSWINRELDVCARVDRVILPCPPAGDELAPTDRRVATQLAHSDYVLTGAAGSSPNPAGATRAQWRRRWRLPGDLPVGLYLGNAQPYRGLDVLLRALDLLPERSDVPGVVAVAGPAVESLPFRRRLCALGHVSDVSGLLRAVDFAINVNRFSLFDLSMIEAAEAGKPLLLHAVGGNLTFHNLGAGCVMLPNLEPPTVAAGLTQMFSLSPQRRQALGRASRACYEAHLTPAHLCERHQQLYDEADSRTRQVGRA